MAEVIPLCRHRPSALDFLIREAILPGEPSPNEYTWDVYDNCDDESVEEEVFYTGSVAVWSQGGQIKRHLNFHLEADHVKQALLTWLPSEPHQDFSTLNRSFSEAGLIANDALNSSNTSKTAASPSRALALDDLQKFQSTHDSLARALVVFVGRQAYISFSSGASCIVRIPFEVERAFPCPRGLIIQPKSTERPLDAPTPLPPGPPPNSFWSFQSQSNLSSVFATAHTSPQATRLDAESRIASSLWHNASNGTHLQKTSSGTRLYTLIDPAAELGLVSLDYGRRDLASSRDDRSSASSQLADEGVLYFSNADELPVDSKTSENPLIFGLTRRPGTGVFTLWRAAYLDQKPNQARPPRREMLSAAKYRRRSSRGFRSSTGANTPIRHPSDPSRESFGGKSFAAQASQGRDDLKVTEGLALDLDSQLREEISMPGIPSANDRRTSSMLARTELATQDSATYQDTSRNPSGTHRNVSGSYRKSQIADSQPGHLSFGKSGRQSFRAASLGGKSRISDYDETMQDILENDSVLDFEPDFDHDAYLAGASPHDSVQHLRTEMTFTKIMDIVDDKYANDTTAQIRDRVRIFTTTDTPNLECIEPSRKGAFIVLHIFDPQTSVLKQIGLTVVNREHPGRMNRRTVSSGSEHFVSVDSSILRTTHVIDAVRVAQMHASFALVVYQDNNGSFSAGLSLPSATHFANSTNKKTFADNESKLYFNSETIIRQFYKTLKREGQDPLLQPYLAHPTRHSIFSLLLPSHEYERFQIRLLPQSKYVLKILQIASFVCLGSQSSFNPVLSIWWAFSAKYAGHSKDVEWRGMITTVFFFNLALTTNNKAQNTTHVATRREKHEMSRTMQNEVVGGTSESNWSWLLQLDATTAKKQRRPLYASQATQLALEALTSGGDSNVGAIHGLLCAKDEPERSTIALKLIYALHLLREEAKLDSLSEEVTGQHDGGLVVILAQMAHWLGLHAWIRQYENENDNVSQFVFDTAPRFALGDEGLRTFRHTQSPPSLLIWTEQLPTGNQLSLFPDLSILTDGKDVESSKKSLAKAFFPRMSALAKLLPSTLEGPAQDGDIIEEMIRSSLQPVTLETLPESVVHALRSVVVRCQKSPPTSWPASKLGFVDRDDLIKVLGNRWIGRLKTRGSSNTGQVDASDVRAICEDTFSNIEAPFERLDSLSLLVFREDKRMNEAIKLLNPARPAVAHLRPDGFDIEAQFLERQKEVAQSAYMRTMALPSGQAVLEFATRQPALTDVLQIPGFTTSCVIYPSGNTVNADRTNFTEEKVCWAWFHAGVETGLTVTRNARGIDTSWFVLNKPSELGNRHAGLLLALGLNGHFKNMAKWLAFKYLTEKHNMTTVGLLIGLSASFLGTMDTLITKILSVHVQCLLPYGSADVNLSSLTQTAGVVGIGLLYYNTQHRRMSEVMLSEIEHLEIEDSNYTQEASFRTEAYRLAAGIALGLINIGRGNNLSGLHDMRVVERLLAVATGPRENPRVHVFDQATAGAIMAFILIFMKSHDSTLARKIDIPKTLEQYDYLRPDMLLLRKLAAKLILWDDIEPNLQYIQEEMPREYHSLRVITLQDMKRFKTEDLAFFNILAALLWSIGLKFAGTGNFHARDLLIRYLDELHRLMQQHDHYDVNPTWNEGFTHAMVTRVEHLVAVSAAMVMSGTGDLPVLRRLRRIHGSLNRRYTFGCHQVLHQAMGILFLGRGRYAFGTSDLAIASLLCAFYPLFPQDVLDNQAHLQALRHFWVFAAEARCLVPRDVETGEPLVIPIRVVLKSREVREDLTAPCLLPEIDTIARIETRHPDYWAVTLDFAGNPAHVEAFQRHQSIWLQRKSLLQSFDGDLFNANLELLRNVPLTGADPTSLSDWLFQLPGIEKLGLTRAEFASILPRDIATADGVQTSRGSRRLTPASAILDTRTTNIDDLAVLQASVSTNQYEQLVGLRVLFAWADAVQHIRKQKDAQAGTMEWISTRMVHRLRTEVMRRLLLRAEGTNGEGKAVEQSMELD